MKEALPDQFAIGIRKESRLLPEDRLTHAKALEIGQGMEAAALKATEFKDAPSAVM